MRILEIGTWEGGTLYHWIKNAPDGARIVSIDNQHMNSALYDEWADNRVDVKWFKGDSKSWDAKEFAKKGYPYDFIFIDADHSYEGVKADWEYYRYLINKNGVIAFHDILPHAPYKEQPVEVDKLWAEIKNKYNTAEIINKSGGDGIGIVRF